MKKSSYIRNDKGIALVAALIVMLLLLVLGAAAMQMSTIGFTSISAEKKYQLANWAAEYGVNKGIEPIAPNTTNPTCPSSGSGTIGTSGYSYIGASIAGNLCYIHATGTQGNAKVVKSVVVPRNATAQSAPLVFRGGGVLDVGGSSSIVNCDPTCKTPGVLYGGSSFRVEVNSTSDDAVCPNNPRGVYGSPYAIQSGNGTPCTTSNGNCPVTGTPLPDQVSMIFNADNWADLLARLSARVYNGTTVNVANLTASGTTVPATTCTCTNALTLISTTNSCTGVADFGLCGGNLRFTGALTINTMPASITNIVAASTITFSGVPGGTTFTGKNFYTTSTTAHIVIDDGDASFNNSKLVSAGNITLTNAGTISDNSLLATTNTGGNITLNDGIISNSTIVAKGTFTHNSTDEIDTTFRDAIRNSFVFSNISIINKGAANVTGGIFYSEGDTTFPSAVGNIQFGSCSSCNINDCTSPNCNPVLLIAGGNISFEGKGTVDIFGSVFANGAINYSGLGGFSISGTVVSNSTTANSIFDGSGNANIRFNNCVICELRTEFPILRAPSCDSGGARGPYIVNTKMTHY